MQSRTSISIICLLAIFIFNANIFAQDEGLEIDRTTVTMPCPPGVRYVAECDNTWIIKVKTQIDKPLKNPKYEYSVSGGQIIGTGRAVEWNMKSARPGTYTITATVTADENFLQTFSKIITVAECALCQCGLCECPNIVISAPPERIKSGGIVTVAANVTGGSQAQVTYKWKVSQGKISEGQGTPVIKVATKKLRGKELTISLEIGGLCEICKNTETSTVRID